MINLLLGFFEKLNKYDLPNWLIAFAWPLFLFYWYRRKVSNVPSLNIFLSAGQTNMCNSRCDALLFRFVNNTGSVVYITNLRLFAGSQPIIHEAADKDFSTNSYELKFLNGDAFELRQITIHTNGSGITFIPLSQQASKELLTFSCSKWRSWLGFPRFFRLEYTALVGDSKYNVSCVF